MASLNLELEQPDVKTALIHGDLEEHIYMEQPEGLKQPETEHLVCRLKKSLYGIKQSPRQWYKQTMQVIRMTGGLPQVMCSHLRPEIHLTR